VGAVLKVLKVLEMRKVPVPTVLAVLGVLGVLVSCGDLRVKEGVFNTVDEARRGGALAAGWIPDRVPPGATDLREGHLPDGRHWGVFAFQAADEAAVRSLVGEEVTTGTLTCDPPGRLEFWPRLINGTVDVAKVRSTGFRIYHGQDGRMYAINFGQGRAYYWK
jgi:hypothetical protein